MLLAKAQIKAAEMVASVGGKPFIYNLNSQLRAQPRPSFSFVIHSFKNPPQASIACPAVAGNRAKPPAPVVSPTVPR